MYLILLKRNISGHTYNYTYLILTLLHLKSAYSIWRRQSVPIYCSCRKKNIFASVSKSSSLKYCSQQMSQAAFSFVFYFKVRFLALNFHTLPKVLLRYFLVARGNSKKDIPLIFCTNQIAWHNSSPHWGQTELNKK